MFNGQLFATSAKLKVRRGYVCLDMFGRHKSVSLNRFSEWEFHCPRARTMTTKGCFKIRATIAPYSAPSFAGFFFDSVSRGGFATGACFLGRRLPNVPRYILPRLVRW